MHERPRRGRLRARYVKLVDLFIAANAFASSAPVWAGGPTLGFLFANALHALASCIAHEELPDSSPLAAALERAVAACSAVTPKFFDGLIISYFGLGLRSWLVQRDRVRAADYYVGGIAAASEAAAARVLLCDYARNKADGCAENLAVLRGEMRLEPSPMNAQRQFLTADVDSFLAGRQPDLEKIAKSLCCAPACAKDMAAQLCGRCRTSRYCNTACQKAHWADHKKVCKKLAA